MVQLLAVLAVGAAPVTIEVMGFSVEPGTLRVVEVEEGSAADTMGLRPGMVLLRLHAPQWPFVGARTLASLGEQDLHDALTPPHTEVLLLEASRPDGGRTVVRGTRTDPPLPPPWEGHTPLSPEIMRRLSAAQLSLYTLHLVRHRRSPRPPRTPLLLDGTVTAELAGGKVVGVSGGGWTPRWVYFDGPVRFECESSPMRAIELIGGGAPVESIIAETFTGTVRASSVRAELPLWPLRAVEEACRTGEGRVPSVRVTGVLRCEGTAPESVPLELPLRCVPATFIIPRVVVLRLDTSTVLVGGDGVVKAEFIWGRHVPRPRKVTVVELDQGGTVVRRHGTMTPPPPGEDSTTTEVRLGVAAERSLQLAAELHYPDGTSAVGEPSPVRVLTAATQARELAAWRAKEARLLDVLERMKHALPDPCADPAATVAWLRQQPGVEFAAASSDGHSISLSTGSGPSALWCHSH